EPIGPPRLLSHCTERPCDARAHKRDELAPPHNASPSNDQGCGTRSLALCRGAVTCFEGPLWVTCGRRPGKNFLTFCSIGRCGHVSGLLMRRGWPLALMLCADRVPIVYTHSDVR